jgi:hypothetical protein
MLNPDANAVLRDGCAAFDRTNGAAEAAEIIIELAEGARMSGWNGKKGSGATLSGTASGRAVLPHRPDLRTHKGQDGATTRST